MKKLLTTVIILTIMLTSSFAAQQSKIDNQINVIINASVANDDYELNISYDNKLVNDSELTLTDDSYVLNSTTTITTKAFDIFTDKGNQNNDMSFTVEITPTAFKGNVNNVKVDTEIIPSIVKTEGSNGFYTFIGNKAKILNTITAGPNPAMSLANFSLSWIGNENVAAGDYSSNIIINYILD